MQHERFFQAWEREIEMRSTGRGKEWYLEKRGSWNILGWSRITEAFLMGLEDSFLGDYCVSHVSIFFLPTILGVSDLSFFSFGSNISGFMCTAYGIEVEKTKQYIGGLSASTGVYLALFVPLSRNFRRLESRENAYSYKSRSQILKVVAKSRIYYSIYPYRCTRMLQMNAPPNRDLLESLFLAFFYDNVIAIRST